MKRINLKEVNKFEKENEFKLLNILEQILHSTYVLIGENIDLDNTYNYELVAPSVWEFQDREKYYNNIKVNYNPGSIDKEITVKFYWVGEDSKPKYDVPLHTDEKIFNTYLKIFINEILPKLDEYFNHFNIDKITLDPVDITRYRLFRIALNKILDKEIYELIEEPTRNLLFIKLR